jgi:hypothetical protein
MTSGGRAFLPCVALGIAEPKKDTPCGIKDDSRREPPASERSKPKRGIPRCLCGGTQGSPYTPSWTFTSPPAFAAICLAYVYGEGAPTCRMGRGSSGQDVARTCRRGRTQNLLQEGSLFGRL